jgi:hypothetical protein
MPKAMGREMVGDLPALILTALILTYEQEIDGVGSVWVARSIVTGHVACGSSETSAKECLRRTIAGSVAMAKRHGKTFDEWFREQRPDESPHVEEYFRRARAGGQRIELSDFGCSVSVAPA